jgi:hypothetical protein
MPKPLAAEGFSLAIEYYREEDGRWLADIAALPGVMAYGRTRSRPPRPSRRWHCA